MKKKTTAIIKAHVSLNWTWCDRGRPPKFFPGEPVVVKRSIRSERNIANKFRQHEGTIVAVTIAADGFIRGKTKNPLGYKYNKERFTRRATTKYYVHFPEFGVTRGFHSHNLKAKKYRQIPKPWNIR